MAQKVLIISLLSLVFCILTMLFVINITQKKSIPISDSTNAIPIPDTLFDKGEQLYKQHCSSCHKLDSELVGPKLEGITQKYADNPKWLYAFIRNSSKLIKKRDKKALKIYEEYNKMPMNSFTFFSDADIKAILYYIKSPHLCRLP